jgi:hypothetical protein
MMMNWDEQTLADELAVHLDNCDWTPLADEAHPLHALMQVYEELETAVEEPDPAFLEDLHWMLIGPPAQAAPTQKESWWSFLTRPRRFPWPRLQPRPIFVIVLLMLFFAMVMGPFILSSPRDVIERPSQIVVNNATNNNAGNISHLTAPNSNNQASEMISQAYAPANDYSFFGFASRYSVNSSTDGDVQPRTAPPQQAEPEAADGTEVAVDPLVVQTAGLAMVVADVTQTQARVMEIVAERNGRIDTLEAAQTSRGEPTAHMALRIPADNFIPTLRELKELSIEVVSEQIESRDVTADYVDMAARLGNLERTEVEIGELLSSAQERGEDSDDIMRIYNNLVGIREQIERIKGQKQLLEHQAAMSLITLTLVNEETVEEITPPEFGIGRVMNEAWVSFVAVLQSITTALIWMGIYSPLVLIPSAIIILVWRRWSR